MTAGQPGLELLRAWPGSLSLLGYGLLAAFLGTLLAVRRDVVRDAVRRPHRAGPHRPQDQGTSP